MERWGQAVGSCLGLLVGWGWSNPGQRWVIAVRNLNKLEEEAARGRMYCMGPCIVSMVQCDYLVRCMSTCSIICVLIGFIRVQ
jgi:hypothetical protein